jgi:CheY-like chemotaxis protein
MYIVIVEDDYSQALLIEEALRKDADLNSSDCEIRRMSTESQFRKHLQELAERNPDVIVMDVMLRWTDPSPAMKAPPDDILKEGCFRAGLRNARLLAQNESTKKIPIILYTMLEMIDLGETAELPGINYLPKDSDLAPLVQAVRAAISNKII